MDLSPSQFADEIGVQRSGVSHILSGRNKPSLDFILKILTRFPEVDADWLLFGKGSMVKKIAEEHMKTKNLVAGPPPPPQANESRPPGGREFHEAGNIARSEEIAYYGESIERIVIFFKNSTFRIYRPR